MLGSILILLLYFVLNLNMHEVVLVKRRASWVLGQSPQLVRPHGVPEFYQGLVMVDTIVVIWVLEIYYYLPVLEQPSFY